jgi:hypothetical protein
MNKKKNKINPANPLFQIPHNLEFKPTFLKVETQEMLF